MSPCNSLNLVIFLPISLFWLKSCGPFLYHILRHISIPFAVLNGTTNLSKNTHGPGMLQILQINYYQTKMDFQNFWIILISSFNWFLHLSYKIFLKKHLIFGGNFKLSKKIVQEVQWLPTYSIYFFLSHTVFSIISILHWCGTFSKIDEPILIHFY